MCSRAGVTFADFTSKMHTCLLHEWFILGVFVTREHVRHNKSGIAHRGRTGINH
jgi:hypothetical protein